MGRTVSLKGNAAAAFMISKMGVPATTEEDRVGRILAWLEMALKDGTRTSRIQAAGIILSVAQDGLEKTADRLTDKRGG